MAMVTTVTKMTSSEVGSCNSIDNSSIMLGEKSDDDDSGLNCIEA